ncbi:MAG: sulfotransferase family protein [Burkholderiales bacterium]
MHRQTSLPNLIVIGAGKTGTTSLHYYLGLHPQIFMSRVKELRYFEKNWGRGVEWYQDHFRSGRNHLVRGETSPQYTAYPRVSGVPERMHALIPGAKLLYVVRDPFERLLSHFVFMAPGRQLADLNRALDPIETNPYVAESRQCWQLEQYLPYYPLSQILVISAEDLRRARRTTLSKVFRFLGVDDSFDSANFDAELNVTEVARRHRSPISRLINTAVGLRPGRFVPPQIGLPIRNAALRLFSRPVSRPSIDTAIEQRLREIFVDDADRLRRLSGLRLEHWSV